MAEIILVRTGMTGTDGFHTIHNYIDTDEMILRKGAIAAHEGEKVLIPINMRDGSVIAIGRGNEEWNYSAPHGAGRIMSRSAARQALSQIEEKDYAVPYAADSRKLYRIGASFNSEKRVLEEWKIE
jgi:RNA-splicing ligase RtcB